MINIKFLTLMVSGALIVQSCTQGSREQTDGTTTMAADTSLDTISKDNLKKTAGALQSEETAFIEKAATGGMMEVELGNLTTQKTKSQRVMEFAKKMIADHTRANQELLEISKKLGLRVPSALPAAEQGHIAEMRQMQGNEYDQNYMQMMVNDHAKTIDLFNAASSFENEALRTFAQKTLPVLQVHNKMAVAIDSIIQVKKPDNRGDDLPNVDKRHKN